MWGAGGAGGSLHCYCGGNCNNGHTITPGCSGAYIEAMVYTNQSNFDIVIGRGGYSNMSTTVCSNNICSLSQYELSYNGGYTTFTNGNVNFAANGGTNHYSSPYITCSTYSIDRRTIIYQTIQGACKNCYQVCDYLDGIQSAFGGNRGIYNSTSNMNGSFPGSGGSAAFLTTNSTCSMITIPTGADGGIILYLTPKNQPDSIITNPPQVISYTHDVILTPNLYQYADNFIIKMWGAGASSGYNCCAPSNPGYGAGSGAFIKAMVYTNQQTFNISIGVGGGSSYNSQSTCFVTCAQIESSNFNGGNTSITSTNINLIAGGGLVRSGGSVSTNLQNTNGIIYIAQQGNALNCISYNGNFNGGISPYTSGNGYEISGYGNGASFYNNTCNQNTCNAIVIPRGNSGGVMLYYTPKSPSSTPSPSISFSRTPNSSQTISPSPIFNPSQTSSESQSFDLPTISPSPIITQSQTSSESQSFDLSTSNPSKTSEPTNINDPSTIYITLTSDSYNSVSKKMLIDVLIVVCILSMISAFLMLLIIIIVYCLKTNRNNFNVDINCNQKVILDNI